MTRKIEPGRSARARRISFRPGSGPFTKKETVPPKSTASASQDPNTCCESESASYDLSAHLLWVGERTRQLDHAHLEFLRGISNPIGVKLGPKMTPEELLGILNTLNPTYEEGKILLICRFGADHVDRCLPPCIKAVQQSKHRFSIFCCDPMHGNTKTAEGLSGIKTRYLSASLRKLSCDQDSSSLGLMTILVVLKKNYIMNFCLAR
jgi:3-deoxy-7-phosphoheptulonate synthase